MALLTRIKLKNMSPLHIGAGRDSYDMASPVLSSDVLSSALASVRVMMGKKDGIDEFLRMFTVSSAFPYDNENYFLPRPNGRLNIRVKNLQESEYRKNLKKLRYISEPIWKQLAKGEMVEIDQDQLHGEFLIAKPVKNYATPMKRISNQRVSVPRVDNKNATPFMFEWTFFRQGETESGLYCLLDCEETVKGEIVALFKTLGSLGIGSDKTIGGGHFDIEVDEMETPQFEGDAMMLLSTYIPLEDEIEELNLSASNYTLIKRGGFIAGSSKDAFKHLRKKTIYMFDTGSVFLTDKAIKGTIVDLSPEWKEDIHPVYRSGRPLYIKIKMYRNDE